MDALKQNEKISESAVRKSMTFEQLCSDLRFYLANQSKSDDKRESEHRAGFVQQIKQEETEVDVKQKGTRSD